MKLTATFITLLTLLLTAAPTLAVEPEPGAVWDTWARTDLAVAEGLATRTWMWGPEALTGPLIEPYEGAPGAVRPVQYFDKARMEITNPDGDPASPWYVTNGLLVVELISGNVQIGDATFEERGAANVNVAGDADDPTGISYALLSGFLDAEPWGDGTFYDGRIHPDGALTVEPALADYAVGAAVLDAVTNHSIAWPFWDFMNSTGVVYEDDAFVQASLFENPYFATGRPITEAYWATVKVAGISRDVLLQCFERRCMTYTPGNPAGFVVEAGNVGQHYYAWRYADSEEEPPPPPPEPDATIAIDVGGIEIDPGDTEGDTTRGLRFVGMASGDVNGAMEVSLDYTPPNPGPGVVNMIVGGSWSITALDGALSGAIQQGSATWDDDVSEAAIQAIFVITTATGAFSGYAGQGSFTGELSHAFFPPRIGGRLVFELE